MNQEVEKPKKVLSARWKVTKKGVLKLKWKKRRNR